MRARRPKVKSNYSRSAIAKRWVFLLLPTRLSVFLFRTFIDNNPERNTLEAAKFSELVVLNFGNPRLFLRQAIRFPLALSDTNLQNLTDGFQTALISCRKHPAQRKAQSARMRNLIDQTSYRDLNSGQWKLLSLTLTGTGFISAGTSARKKCLIAAISEIRSGSKSSRVYHLALTGLIERRYFCAAKSLIKQLQSFTNSSHSYSIYTEFIDLLERSFTNPQKFETLDADEFSIEKKFIELIFGKTVAVVGTAEITSLSGAEIDSFQTRARVKYQGRNIMPDPEFAGRECDLSFYTEDLVKKFLNLSRDNPNEIDFLSELQLIVVKSKTKMALKQTNVRNLPVYAPTFISTATSGTLFVYDIARLSPKNVKLFGFNFYTHRNTYNKALFDFYGKSNSLRDIGLPKDWFDFRSERKRSAIIASGFVSHDPRSDFLFVKNLYELSGLIDGTPEVLEILNLTADEYDMRLEEMLGDW